MSDTIQIDVTREQLLQAIKRLPEPDIRWLVEQTSLPSQSLDYVRAEERRLQAWQQEYEYITKRINNFGTDQPPQPRSWTREELYDR